MQVQLVDRHRLVLSYKRRSIKAKWKMIVQLKFGGIDHNGLRKSLRRPLWSMPVSTDSNGCSFLLSFKWMINRTILMYSNRTTWQKCTRDKLNKKNLILNSIFTDVLPSKWKKIPIITLNPYNYHSISILPFLTKVLEYLVHT